VDNQTEPSTSAIPAAQDYDSADLADFAQTIMKGCDTDRDGKISKKVTASTEQWA
jgi:hypothetical protein